MLFFSFLSHDKVLRIDSVVLYADVIKAAQLAGALALTCEYNIQPPNLISARFHSKWGFEALGSQWLGGGSKQVSLQALKLDR